MKYQKSMLCIVIAIASVILLSCSSNSTSNNPVTASYEFKCTLNGGGFTNQVISYSKAGLGVFLPSQNATGLNFSGSSTGEAATITFTGNSTGNFTFGTSGIAMIITFADNSQIAITTGTLAVTAYGSIGGDIKGTFSGTGISSTAQTVQITNGTFTAKRAS
jgi:hypothetical protein